MKCAAVLNYEQMLYEMRNCGCLGGKRRRKNSGNVGENFEKYAIFVLPKNPLRC